MKNLPFSLAQKYCDEVANPMEMIVFRKLLTRTKRLPIEQSDNMDDISELFQGDVKKLLLVLAADTDSHLYVIYLYRLTVIGLTRCQQGSRSISKRKKTRTK